MTPKEFAFPEDHYNTHRVKPDGLKYRIGLYQLPSEVILIMCVNEAQEREWWNSENFIKWVTDWQEVEVGE